MWTTMNNVRLIAYIVLILVTFSGFVWAEKIKTYAYPKGDPNIKLVRKTLRQAKNDALEFYAISHKKNGEHGRVIFKYHLRDTGNVIDWELVSSEIEDEEFLEHLETLLRNISFVGITKEMKFTYKFNFQPEFIKNKK